MKHYSLAVFLLAVASANAQETPLKIKRNEYKSINISYSSYSKPQTTNIYSNSLPVDENTLDNVKRNNGFSLSYTQMNFIKNCGLEFGLGLEFMQISSRFNFTLPTSPEPSNITLSSMRSNIVNVNLPLHYVHRFELGKGFTLFPKIGLDTKIMVSRQTTGMGNFIDNDNRLNYTVRHETSNRNGNLPLENVFFNGTIGSSLAWTAKNGSTFGVNFAFSMQLFQNELITRVNNLVYKKDGQVVYSGGEYQARNKTSNISVGISYIFGK